MAVAFDAAAELERTNTSDPATWTHTPVATRPMAIVVSAVHGTSSTDHVSTVTYGGVSMSRVIRATDTVTEAGAAELWFLGAGIPSGAQTVSADLTSGTTDDIHFVSMSFTANCSCEVVDSDSISENATDPSRTLSYGGRTCISVAALYGGAAAPSSFTPNGNCETVHDRDLGAFYSEVIRQSTPGTSDFAIGGTASADDVAYVALALAEDDAAPILYPTGQSVTVTKGTSTVSPYADAVIRVGTTSKITAPLFTSGVSTSPTGQSVTASQGTVSVTVSSAASPATQVATTAQGTVALVVDSVVSPATQVATTTQGTATVETGITVSPTGQEATSAQGTVALTVDSVASPATQVATVSQGTATAGAGAQVDPTGQEATTAQGTAGVSVSSVVSPAGQAATADQGTASAAGGAVTEPTGQEATTAQGTVSVTVSSAVEVSGQEAVTAQGTASASGDAPAAPPETPSASPIPTRWQRVKQRPMQLLLPLEDAPAQQDAVVRVSGMGMQARAGTTWLVVDRAIAPAGQSMAAVQGTASARGMHNPTDEQIVEWLIQALSASV